MTSGIRTGAKTNITNIKNPTKLAMVSLTLSAGRISCSSVIPNARRRQCRTPERPTKLDYKSLTFIQSRLGLGRSSWRTSEVTDLTASITVRSKGCEHGRPRKARDRQSCWASTAPVHVVVPREMGLRSNCRVGRVLLPGWPPIVGLKPFAPRCPAVGVGGGFSRSEARQSTVTVSPRRMDDELAGEIGGADASGCLNPAICRSSGG